MNNSHFPIRNFSDFSVLEVGVGAHGFVMEELLKFEGLERLVGIEISEKMMFEFKQKYSTAVKAEQLELYDTDCIDMRHIFPQDHSVDRILAVNVIYFLHPLEKYLREIYRILKRNTGKAIISCKTMIKREEDPTFTLFKNLDFETVLECSKNVGFEVSREDICLGDNVITDHMIILTLSIP